MGNCEIHAKYVRVQNGESLQSKLESVAAFGELRDPCKVASRLELMASSASPDRQFELKVGDFGVIEEPQPSSYGGKSLGSAMANEASTDTEERTQTQIAAANPLRSNWK